MPDMATIPEHQTSLHELAHCSVCGTSMTLIGDNYVCPVNAERASDRCYNTSVNAGTLVHAVTTQLLKRVMTDDTVIMLTEDIQQTAGKNRACNGRVCRTPKRPSRIWVCSRNGSCTQSNRNSPPTRRSPRKSAG